MWRACRSAALLLSLLRGAAAGSSRLCPSDRHGGAFVALAADVDAYAVTAPADGGPERWVLVDWAARPASDRVNNSFVGEYLQVLPDDGDDYNKINSERSFVWTGLEFKLRVDRAATYTLFARWSGGDHVGGGDSMYVLARDATGAVVKGAPTWREQTVGIADEPGMFSGCCYDMSTHACPCATEAAADAEAACVDGGGYWVETAKAVNWGATCPAGEGKMESVAPRWYEFAGQEYGNVMDFDSEPWDATCEAEGTGTADSGRDEATWTLAAGDYTLTFYPREDGVAIDAIYLAPFGAPNPDGLVLARGESSLCRGGARAGASGSGGSAGGSSALRAVLIGLAVVIVAVAVGGLVLAHPAGKRCLARLRGGGAASDAQAYRAPYVEMMAGDNLPEPLVVPGGEVV